MSSETPPSSSPSPSPSPAPTSPLNPLAPYPPYKHAGPKSRAPEFYGFFAWISTLIVFVVYILWALLPDEWIVWFGVVWYPSREWSILLPAYSIVLIMLAYYTYWALALYETPAMDDLRSFTHASAYSPAVATFKSSPDTFLDDEEEAILSAYVATADPKSIPRLYDIPITLVNRVLYADETTSGPSTTSASR